MVHAWIQARLRLGRQAARALVGDGDGVGVTGRDVRLVVLLFVASRLLYHGLGIAFDASNSRELWQLLDLHALRTELWTSILHLHAQPPLFNMLVGGFLKLFGDGFTAAMGLLYMLVNLWGCVSCFKLTAGLFGSRFLSWSSTLLLILAPSGILYENKLYYEGLVAPLLVAGFCHLHGYLARGRARDGALAYGAFCAVVLMRSAFHPAWLLLLALLPFAGTVKPTRKALAAAVLPCLVVGGVMAKNLVLFGAPGLSSWLGSSMARMVVDPVPWELKAGLIHQGVLSQASAAPSFAEPEVYARLLTLPPPSGVAANDLAKKQDGGYPNFNANLYLKLNPMLAQDAMRMLAAHPRYFGEQVAVSLAYFNRPLSEFKGLEANAARIAPQDRLYKLLVEGQPAALWTPGAQFGVLMTSLAEVAWVNLAFFVVALYASIYFCLPLLRAWRRPLDPTECFMACLAFTVLYAMVITNVLDVLENNRARYMINPILNILVFALLFRHRLSTHKLP